MRKLFLILLFSTAYAALPPLAQSMQEIEAIVSDPELYQLLGGAEPIQEIKRIEGGYLVSTRSQAVQVVVTYLPRGGPGPAKFSLEFYEM